LADIEGTVLASKQRREQRTLAVRMKARTATPTQKLEAK
jgi:hypothetical protein